LENKPAGIFENMKLTWFRQHTNNDTGSSTVCWCVMHAVYNSFKYYRRDLFNLGCIGTEHTSRY
jgi:hypothetical protein